MSHYSGYSLLSEREHSSIRLYAVETNRINHYTMWIQEHLGIMALADLVIQYASCLTHYEDPVRFPSWIKNARYSVVHWTHMTQTCPIHPTFEMCPFTSQGCDECEQAQFVKSHYENNKRYGRTKKEKQAPLRPMDCLCNAGTGSSSGLCDPCCKRDKTELTAVAIELYKKRKRKQCNSP